MRFSWILRCKFFATLGLALVAAALAMPSETRADTPLSYTRDIRPIFSDRCFSCHGPDADARQAELRLDREEQATADRGGYAAIVPADLESSEVWLRITTDDPDLKMPPAVGPQSLSKEEIERIRRWILQGAEYEKHWAFVPATRPPLPAATGDEADDAAIDRFIRKGLTQQGLSPSPPADPTILARRVSLDLIGLPPTEDAAQTFLADVAARGIDAAYARLVDQLLESPRYGEHWARPWLDLARYADTNGYEKDRPREIWAYRDWVIDALNADMPFRDFTIAQIAGDLLPDATVADRIATGFHRNTMLNEEGGIDPLEYRFHAMTDRIATTGTTWLGLTVGCAQCHSHKYDPISHREYYQLMAFLNNADEPELDLPDPSLDALHKRNRERAADLLRELPARWPAGDGDAGSEGGDDDDVSATVRSSFEAWQRAQRAKLPDWQILAPVRMHSNLPLLQPQPDGSVYASGDSTKNDWYRVGVEPVPARVSAIRLEALPDARLPAHGPGMTFYEGTRGDFFLGEFQVFADGQPVPISRATHSYAKNRFGNHPVSAALTLDGDPQTGWSVHGRQGERHVAVFVLDPPLEAASRLEVRMRFGRHYSSSLGRFRLSAADPPGDWDALDLPETVEIALATPAAKRTADQQQRLWEQFLLDAPELSEASAAIRELLRPPVYPTTLVMQERPENNPRPTYVHHRGEYLQATDQVSPDVPDFLHAFPAGQSRDRLGFAHWLVADENPLTARALVNRQWAAFFGRGLVPTLDDFGHQGQPPSHPELLDWLAVEFRATGGSLKRLHRMIVTSKTYRQTSQVSPESLALDPENRWLARAPRPRLAAEVIRDAALQASGLLSVKMGGPGVRPPQPEGVTEVAYGSPSWQADRGPDRYRRSIYTFRKRTAPFALYTTFDAPSGEACTARRDVSNTPLQALTLMNDVVFLEAARALGRQAAGRPASDAERAGFLVRRVLTRSAQPEEIRRMLAFVASQRQRFAAAPQQAEAVAGTVDRDVDDRPVEPAVWTSLARALFCLDEAITRN